jgi:8-oxo-dGTP pyrophosphatase MutT (NUDIX family)
MVAAPHTCVDVMVIVERSDGSVLLTACAAEAEGPGAEGTGRAVEGVLEGRAVEHGRAGRAGRAGDAAVLRLPGGRTGPGESVVDAAARELYAATGIRAEPDALRLVHVMQYRAASGHVRVGWFLAATPWPARTSWPAVGGAAGGPAGGAAGTGPAWYRPDRLPGHTAAYDALGIAHYLKGEPFSVHGW